MRVPPLEVLASRPRPNYINPETRGPANLIVGSILVTLAFVIVIIRLYTRIRISRGFGTDDVLIVAAFVPATAFVVTGLVAGTEYQWDRHVWDIEPSKFEGGIKLGLACLVLFNLATTLTKLSMLALIYRFSRSLKTVVIVSGLFIILSSVSFNTILFTQCTPIEEYWRLSFEPQNCINESLHLLIAGIINTVTDYYVVLLPMVIIPKITMLPKRQVAIIIALFGVGLIASTAGAVRTYFTWRMTHSVDFDTTWHAYASYLASSVELFLGIICASIPATKPFFSQYMPRMLDPISFLSSRSSSVHHGSTAELGNDKFVLSSAPPSRAASTASSRSAANVNKPLPKVISKPMSISSVESLHESSQRF